ncbi:MULTISPECIES: hypothetical protein [unclassified Fredinandcohnia]|uniref:hypothetical protein n=1 Tax=unclassified Fredinandcohnia TaxID=2837514 RepID=UPI000EAE6D5D
MNKKWFLKLMGSLLAVFLVTGCNADDQDPPPEDDGLETPGEDFNNELDNDVTPEEDVVPGDNDMNNNDNDLNGDGNLIEDDNNDGDLDVGKDDNDELGDNDLVPDEDNGGTNGAGGGK